MDALNEKQKRSYDYISRYSPFYFYYNENDDKYIYGITSQLNTDTQYVIHTVKDSDTLNNLAYKYYGRPDLFWVIADFNRIKDSYTRLFGNYITLKIPDITSIKFE